MSPNLTKLNLILMKLIKMLAIGAVALTVTSCVSQKQYDALNLNYKQAVENVAE